MVGSIGIGLTARDVYGRRVPVKEWNRKDKAVDAALKLVDEYNKVLYITKCGEYKLSDEDAMRVASSLDSILRSVDGRRGLDERTTFTHKEIVELIKKIRGKDSFFDLIEILIERLTEDTEDVDLFMKIVPVPYVVNRKETKKEEELHDLDKKLSKFLYKIRAFDPLKDSFEFELECSLHDILGDTRIPDGDINMLISAIDYFVETVELMRESKCSKGDRLTYSKDKLVGVMDRILIKQLKKVKES